MASVGFVDALEGRAGRPKDLAVLSVVRATLDELRKREL